MRHSVVAAPAKRHAACAKRLIGKVQLLSERSIAHTEALELFVDHVLSMLAKRPHRHTRKVS